MMEHGELSTQLREIFNATDYRKLEQREDYYLAHEQAVVILHQKELYSRDDFDAAIEKYVNLSIENSIGSKDVIVRALAMLDRRLGKRRLSHLEICPTEAQIVREFYTIRCRAENIKPDSQTA
jgi:hypothetical protein